MDQPLINFINWQWMNGWLQCGIVDLYWLHDDNFVQFINNVIGRSWVRIRADAPDMPPPLPSRYKYVRNEEEYHWNVKADGSGGWLKAEGTAEADDGEALLPAGRK